MMRTMKRIVATVAVAAATTAVLAGMTGTAAQAATVHGCGTGWVCLYPQGAGWNSDRPSQKWYNYGNYPLYDQYGSHYILNNQTGGAPVWLCTDYPATNCPSYVAAGRWASVNFTPINSVKLVPSL